MVRAQLVQVVFHDQVMLLGVTLSTLSSLSTKPFEYDTDIRRGRIPNNLWLIERRPVRRVWRTRMRLRDGAYYYV